MQLFEEKNTDKTEPNVEKEKINYFALFKENRNYIYSFLFYVAGLIFGAVLYAKFSGEALNTLVIADKSEHLLQQFISVLSKYLLVFSVSVLLGICLIGFPLVNAVPLILGFETAVRITYYYCNYGIRGFGYTLLMIAPFACILMTIIMLTINKSFELSKRIYDLTVKRADCVEEINYKSYLKSYLFYGVFVIIAAFSDAVATVSLSEIIVL